MVSTRTSNKLKRASRTQERGKCINVEDSDDESIDWDAIMAEVSDSPQSKEEEPAASKQKKSQTVECPLSVKRKQIAERLGRRSKAETTPPISKTPPSTAGKESQSKPPYTLSVKRKTLAKRKFRGKGTTTEKSPSPDSPSSLAHECVVMNRMKAFEDRECIGERYVDIDALRIRSPEFGSLIEQANLFQVCKFGDTNGYCLQLIRSFYANAQQLQDNEGGPIQFYTLVRGTSIRITPQLIGDVLGMEASVAGTSYLKGTSLTESSFKTVQDAICLPNTQITGFSVNSKDLRLEYKFLNFMVCYNILPNMQTKILRWDRMFFLYLLGHPMEAVGLNVNIPFVIWSRMARFVDHSRNPERLPYPLIIMRILQKLGVDTNSMSYQHCSKKIDDSTVLKSLKSRVFDTFSPQGGKTPAAATSPFQMPAGASSQTVPPSEDEATVASLHRDLRKLSVDQEKIKKTQERMLDEMEIITASQVVISQKCKGIQKALKRISEKNGCVWSDESESD